MVRLTRAQAAAAAEAEAEAAAQATATAHSGSDAIADESTTAVEDGSVTEVVAQEKSSRAPLSEIVANAADQETAVAEPETGSGKGKGKKKKASRSRSVKGKKKDDGATADDAEVKAGDSTPEEVDEFEQVAQVAQKQEQVQEQNPEQESKPEQAQEQVPDQQQEQEQQQVLEANDHDIAEIDASKEKDEEMIEHEASVPDVEAPHTSRINEEAVAGSTRTIIPDTHNMISTAQDTNETLHNRTDSVEPQQELLTANLDLRGESPSIEPEEIVMIPQRTPAKKLLAQERSGMRSTSNKENEVPYTEPTTRDVLSSHGLAEGFGVADETNVALQEQAPHPDLHVDITTSNGDTSAPVTEASAQSEKASIKSTGGSSSLSKTASSRTKTPGPRVDSKLGRSTSVRTNPAASKSNTAQTAPVKRTLSTRKPVPRPSTAKSQAPEQSKQPTKEKAPVVIPHSKPRPVSMSFPAPAGPPKSSKPPTKPTFQLPGEAIAAKLKAAKEERMKKEEEEQDKRRAFKARPAPKFKDGPAVVRQTASSRARESLMLGKPPSDNGAAPATSGLKRATSVRESMITGRGPAIASKRVSTIQRKAPDTIVEKEPAAASITVNKRASTALGNTFKPQASSTTTHSTAAGAGTKKGKEVFQRAAAEKDALEKQRREKEEAAKKARADAAEKGRIASREWAEKMKLKALKAKGVQNTAATGAVRAVPPSSAHATAA